MCLSASRHHVSTWIAFCPQHQCVLMDLSGKDCSQQFTHDTINKYCGDEEVFRLKQDPALLQALVPKNAKRSKKEGADTQKSVPAHNRHESSSRTAKRRSQSLKRATKK